MANTIHLGMNDELFAELIASVAEAGGIERGEAAPSRTITRDREPLDVARIRERYQLSRTRFAALLGVSVKTLRNWEQGRRAPVGPAAFPSSSPPSTLTPSGASCASGMLEEGLPGL